jgi:hypothetical protein
VVWGNDFQSSHTADGWAATIAVMVAEPNRCSQPWAGPPSAVSGLRCTHTPMAGNIN